MATVKYILRSQSKSAPIYLRLSLSRSKSYKRKTELSINAKEWSTIKSLPKQNTSANKQTTTKLRKLSITILDQVNTSNSIGEKVNGEWLSYHIDLFFNRVSLNNQSELMTDAIQHLIDTAKTRNNSKGGIGLSKGRIGSYKRLKALFKEFQHKRSYNVKEVDKIIFEKFKTWLIIKKKYAPTYSLKKLSDLKTVCKDARANGIEISTDLNDINTKQVSTYDDDMDVIFLNPSDIEKIEKANLTNPEHLNGRKWLILACELGQRGSTLTKKIHANSLEKFGDHFVIRVRQKKGNKSVTIPVLPKVLEIFDNGFPKYMSVQKLNKLFKEIGEIAKVNEPTLGRLQDPITKRVIKKIRPKYKYISLHIGRKSFCSNHYGKIPTPIIMAVTGHAKESTLLLYVNKSDESHVQPFLDYYKRLN
jgi:integrase